MITVSLQYCVLNFSQVQYIDLSEKVQFVEAGIIVITVHLKAHVHPRYIACPVLQ